ncbi:phosphopantetheine-binding protein [Epilithonimonas sp. JDS]|uniref:phosphopantetheine-binding protein n=1 Tax=Epilithonimonas sp. JDS TaxID=2902797 RepID=UPI001E2F7F6F|nr:phosphopantetheine-binding protein [Epilithonimonas sp. JDS]MCD9854190.1 phosphopantetheine-binding protein [Epilithonimonas sp. JDS]
MNTQTFLEKLQDELEEDDALTLDTKFKELENYDSMSVLSLIAFIDESFDKSLDTKHFKDISTVQELKELIGSENFED